MKLIIDINENEYLGIKSFPDSTTSYPWTLHLYEAVRNGTQLNDIKAEILDYMTEDAMEDYDYGHNDGLERALKIIDKHIGKE